MKKLLVLLFALVLCFGLVACNPGTPTTQKEQTNLEKAAAYVFELYKSSEKDKPTVDTIDVSLISSAPVGGEFYSVTWEVRKIREDDLDVAVLKTKEDGSYYVEITYDPEFNTVTTNYQLIATISDGTDEIVKTFERQVPAYLFTTYEEWIENCKTGSDTVMNIRAYVIASVSTGSSSGGSLYLQDAEGHGYYAYKPALSAEDKASDEALRAAYPYGCEVIVSGTGTVYGGQYEFNSGCTVKKTGASVTELPATDATAAFAGATDAKDTALIPYQNAIVTLTGCTLTKADGDYYYFTIGENEVKFNLYDSYYFLSTADRDAWKANYLGAYTATITGIVSCYSNSYQIYPIGPDAISNLQLPAASDADAIAIEKDLLDPFGGVTNITEAITVTLPSAGAGYSDQVSITWALDQTYDFAVIEDGKLTVTLPSEIYTIVVTATLTAGDVTDTKTFTLQVDAVATDVYVPVRVDAPVKDTAYKLALDQNNLGQTLYFAGSMSGNYLATTDKADKAVDVTMEEVEGGYRLYFMDGETKTYIDVYEYTTGKAGLRLTAEPTGVYTYNTDANTFFVTVADADWYLGTYKTFNTISVSKTSYITGDNAANVGVSQFPVYLATLAPGIVVPEAVETPVKDTAYKLALDQNNLGQTLYFAGGMSGNYLATTDKTDKAVDVTLEEVEGGYRMFFMDGETKTYIDVYEYTTGKAGLRLTAEPTGVYTYNTDAKTLFVTVADADWYLGTYKTFNTISVSKTSYITGDNAANVGVSQFPAYFATLKTVELEAKVVTEPVKETAYKLAMNQNNLGQTLYFAGSMSGNYLATTDRPSKAVDVMLEEVEGGFRLYFMDGETKTYIDVYEYTTGKAGLRLTAEPTGIFTFDTEANTLFVNVADADWYLGTYKTFNTISVSKTSYITGDNAANVGVSQFPTFLAVLGPKEVVTEITPEDKVEEEKKNLSLGSSTILSDTVIDLPAVGETYDDVTITWASDNECAVIADGKLTITLPSEEVAVTITATITCGEVSVTREFVLSVKAAEIVWTSVEDAIAACKALDDSINEISKGWYYIRGTVGTVPTSDFANFNLTDGTNAIIVYGVYTQDGTQAYGSKKDIAEIPFGALDTVELYCQLQNYKGKLEIVNARLLSYNVTEKTAEQKIAFEMGNLTAPASSITSSKTVNVATVGAGFADVTITWASDNAAAAAVDGGKITYTQPTDADATVTLTATFTCGEVSQTVTYTVTVEKLVIKTYTKVTEAPKDEAGEVDWSGTYLVVYEASTTEGYVFSGVDAAYGSTKVAINGNTISSEGNDINTMVVTIAKMEGGYSIKVNGKYIGGKSGSNTIVFSDTTELLNTIGFDDKGNLRITSDTAVLVFNKTANQLRFRYYKSESYAGQQATVLYKLDDAAN